MARTFVSFLRELNLTQAELARLLTVGAQQVARWEKSQCAMPG
jgi:DNA-binding transcriptional regulator YiaG